MTLEMTRREESRQDELRRAIDKQTAELLTTPQLNPDEPGNAAEAIAFEIDGLLNNELFVASLLTDTPVDHAIVWAMLNQARIAYWERGARSVAEFQIATQSCHRCFGAGCPACSEETPC